MASIYDYDNPQSGDMPYDQAEQADSYIPQTLGIYHVYDKIDHFRCGMCNEILPYEVLDIHAESHGLGKDALYAFRD